MNAPTFDHHAQSLLDLAKNIADAKRPGYTQGNEDVLKNFKDAAALLPGVTPTQAWAVYFYKHIAAILSWAADSNIAQAESLDGRFADAINYLKLGYGLFKEQTNPNISLPGLYPSGSQPVADSSSFEERVDEGIAQILKQSGVHEVSIPVSVYVTGGGEVVGPSTHVRMSRLTDGSLSAIYCTSDYTPGIGEVVLPVDMLQCPVTVSIPTKK